MKAALITANSILERDLWRCLRCGSAGPLHVHHRILGNRKDMRPSNLVTLCLPCHAEVHKHGEAAREEGWIVSRYGNREATAEIPVRALAGPILLDDEGFWRAWVA